MIRVNVGSPAGAYSVGSSAFFRYVVRLRDVGVPIRPADRDAVALLGAIPHAFHDEGEDAGNGWRVVPAASYEDWPVLEAAPGRLGEALETARRVLWENAARAGISAREISTIDDEIENVLAVLARAEAAGYPVNISYVS